MAHQARKRKNSHECFRSLGYDLSCLYASRDGGIRTRDPLNPIQVRYRAALRPVHSGLLPTLWGSRVSRERPDASPAKRGERAPAWSIHPLEPPGAYPILRRYRAAHPERGSKVPVGKSEPPPVASSTSRFRAPILPLDPFRRYPFRAAPTPYPRSQGCPASRKPRHGNGTTSRKQSRQTLQVQE